MTKLLIFDFDGVLADSLAPMLKFAKQVCIEMGVSTTPTRNDLEILDRMEFSEFGLQLGIPEDQIDHFVARNHQLFSEMEEPAQLVPGMGSVLSTLATDNYLAIITGNSCNQVEKFLETHQLRGYFKHMYCAEHKGTRLDKIRKVTQLANMKTSDTYMIGDAVSDIRAAKAAGVNSIAVTWGHQSKEKLNQENPDKIVERPVDLLEFLSA